MKQKSEQEYIEDALNMIWRGKRDEKVKEALMAQGLDEASAKRIVIKAHDSTKRNIRSANKKTAWTMVVGGCLGVIVGLGLCGFLIFMTMTLQSRRISFGLAAIGIALITGGGGLYSRGMNILNKMSMGNDSDYIA